MRSHLQTQFERMGARLKLEERPQNGSFTVDVRADVNGEYFLLHTTSGADATVVDLDQRARHLLLLVADGASKHKFLCGHDERHWFAAAVPDRRGIVHVQDAMEALKPADVRRREDRLEVRPKVRNRRRNAAFVRQGEWFFVPVPELKVNEALVMRHEPITRAPGNKPHTLEFAYRMPGERFYVSSQYPRGLREREYRALLKGRPKAAKWTWQVMTRAAFLYARGRVRHADHRTIVLHGWHAVLMNTENEAPGQRNLLFLD